MADAVLLLTIIVAVFAAFGLIRFVRQRRRAARSLITTPSRVSRLGDHAQAVGEMGGTGPGGTEPGRTEPGKTGTGELGTGATETDAERRERLVEQAFMAGAVPAVWYRHAKAALAAEAAEAERTHG